MQSPVKAGYWLFRHKGGFSINRLELLQQTLSYFIKPIPVTIKKQMTGYQVRTTQEHIIDVPANKKY